MSSCNPKEIRKFVISTGIDNTFSFTIKEDNVHTPMAIAPSDTFMGIFKLLSNGSTVFSKPLSVTDATNGKLELFISKGDTKNFTADRGDPEDRYYLKPVYSLVLVCDTLVNGSFLAKVPYIYVD